MTHSATERYNPRHDPDFPSIVVNHLIRNQGEWCHPQDLFTDTSASTRRMVSGSVHEAVDMARHCGLRIESDKVLGYRFVEWVRADARYMHTKTTMRWPRARPDGPSDGQ
jgi:hypothetical protein